MDLFRQKLSTYLIAIITLLFFIPRLALIVYLGDRGLSSDLYSWGLVGELLAKGHNPYIATASLNWPPAWMIVIAALQKLSEILLIDIILLIKLTLISAEFILMLSCSYLMYQLGAENKSIFLTALFGFCLNPVLLMLNCIHGNFDVIVCLFQVFSFIALLLYVRYSKIEAWYFACFLLGISTFFKTFSLLLLALVFIPAIKTSRSTKFIGLILYSAPCIAAVLTIFVLAPDDILNKVIFYSSSPGWFGITGIMGIFALQEYFYLAKIFFLLSFICLEFYLISKLCGELNDGLKLAAAFLITLISIPLLGPGFGAQYLHWIIPFSAVLYFQDSRKIQIATVLLLLISSITLGIEYLFIPANAFLLNSLFVLDSNSIVYEISNLLKSERSQTILRLPLFLALGNVFILRFQALRLAR